MVGETEPFELIEIELNKAKCRECKKEHANYFVFNNGFFCTNCFGKLKQVEFLQLLDFAKILYESAISYKKQKGSPNAAFTVIGEEIKKKYEVLKTKRDNLQTDLATQKNKTLQKLDFLNEACEQANINEPLEELYEPSLRGKYS